MKLWHLYIFLPQPPPGKSLLGILLKSSQAGDHLKIIPVHNRSRQPRKRIVGILLIPYIRGVPYVVGADLL